MDASDIATATPEALQRFVTETLAANRLMRDALALAEENAALKRRIAEANIAAKSAHDLILAAVAASHGLSVIELRCDRRSRCFAWPRQEAMWRLRQVKLSDGRPRYSLPAIARIVGVGDHTTVLHGIRAYAGRMAALARAEDRA
jgi:chromosomal replication initiation ATPase DnaA